MLSGVPVFLFTSLIAAHLFQSSLAAMLGLIPSDQARQNAARLFTSDTYPVLVEQKYAPKPRTRQKRALSNVTAQGQGALTYAKGFNSISPDDTVDLSRSSGEKGSKGAEKQVFEGEGERQQDRKGRPGAGAGSNRSYKIPFNYNFRQVLALNFGETTMPFSIPRLKMPGFRYFQNMLGMIRDAFSSPGVNMYYRDNLGTVIHNPIAAQYVDVLFSLDDNGLVREVKVSRPGRTPLITRACREAIDGQNFGPPPPEVLKLLRSRDNIIGLRFVFPPPPRFRRR